MPQPAIPCSAVSASILASCMAKMSRGMYLCLHIFWECEVGRIECAPRDQ